MGVVLFMEEWLDAPTCCIMESDTSKELLKPPHGPGVPLIKKNGPPKIVKVQTSTILSQVRSFLPELAEANKILNNKDIENISDEESEHIEMDLAIFPVSYSSSDSSSDESDIDNEQHKILQYTDIQTLKLNSFTSRNTTHKLNIIEELPNK